MSSNESTISSIKSLDKPLDNIIYKVKRLVDNNIDTIYIFYGTGETRSEEELIKTIFSDKESDEIAANKSKIVFSKQRLYPDDSIATIKIKILNELSNIDVSIEEIYLFCKKIETLNSVSVYQSLTQNTKIALTRLRLEQFIDNICCDLEGNAFPKPEDKDIYSYDDIFEMKIDNKDYIVNKVLGQKFFIVENEYPFVCNPFDIKEYDKFFEQNSRKSLSTLNNHLLLNSGKIVDNTIYLCLAQDVLSSVEQKDLSQQTTIKIYYPFIYNKNILSLEDLERNRAKLIEANKKFNNEKTLNLFNTVNMFYDIYDLRTKELNYVEKGIKFIKAIMKPEFSVRIPLEIIFKIVHATEINPLIKYNPSSRQENIYRLYADKLSVDGRKIPFLKKAVIFRLMKTIARTKSVSIYIQTKDDQILNCEFDEEGYITMTAEFNTLIDISEIDEIFRNLINPVIQEIKSVLEQSGYKLSLFNSLTDHNVEIKLMTYETNISLSKSFDIDAYKSCISSIFINETNRLKSDKMNLRFKRVANFSKFTSQEVFVLEKSEQGLRGDEIIQALLENFPDDLTREQATELVVKIANELEVERGVRKSDIKIKENPGFKTEITFDNKSAILKIVTENINNINYLYTLPIYLDTIVRLTQDKSSTKYPIQEINKLCGGPESVDIVFPEITSSTELSAKEGEDAEIEGDESIDYVKYVDVEKEKPKGAFSLFFDEDESDENYESQGGNNNFEGGQISSEESVSTESDEKTTKLKYGNVTVPTGISSPNQSLSEESVSSEKIASLGSLAKDSLELISSEKSLSSIKVDDTPSEESVASEKSLSSIKIASPSEESVVSDKPLPSEESVISDKPLSSIKIASPSEESVASEKPLPSEESVISDKPLSSIKIASPSEESVASEKPLPFEESVTSEKSSPSEESVVSEKPLPFEESVASDKPLSSIKIASPSEESVASDKPLPSEESVTSEKSSPSEESVASEKSLSSIKADATPSEQPEAVLSPIKDESVESKKVTKRKMIIESSSEEEEKSDEEEEKSDEEEEKSDEEEPDEEEPDEESEEEEIRNIDGIKLNKPYYFQTLIEKKDPILIVKEDSKEYNAYSRTCSSDKRRQPIILTDNQLEKINEEHPGFLREQDVIKYGSDKKHQFNYICPRYWCLKSNTFINPEDIKVVNGEKVHKPKKGPSCGKVLPKKENKVKPGYYIYEFNDNAYPGLIPDKHPNGLCLPCCFKHYNTKGRIVAKEKCLENKKVQDDEPEIKKIQDVSKSEEYILGPEKFPLESGRWGYLPPEIQTILHEINADCQVSKTNTNIKENHPCLLRHGIEVNKNQSFIAAISDVIFFGKRVIDEDNKLTTKTSKVLTITEMRERIIKAIDIDSFIKYQNGNLVNDFYDEHRKVNIEKYKTSKLYSKMNFDNKEELVYFERVISAFENFTLFLQDDEVMIDHTYLWDIISMPNKYLFPQGVNLVIFQIPHEDITNNVQLICPTNHYSSEFYQVIKPTIILIKEDGYYEPIYSYLFDGKKLIITKEFKERDPHLSKTMRAVFKDLIKPFFESICRPLESMPNVYKAKRPLLLYDLVRKLDKYEYKIKKLVMNFNNKIIGILAQEPSGSEKTGFIPCYPSALNENLKKDLDYVFMNDLSLWTTYTETIQFLNRLNKRSKKRRDEPDIPCKPAFKIIEDELVVGILTNTNQFIQISEPIPPDQIIPELDLPSITDEDYIVNPKSKPMVQSDIKIITEQTVDVEREDYIKRLKLETSFYNVFRNTIKILINNYENIKSREKIENELLKEYIIYSSKLENVVQLLKELVGNKIQFIGDENYYKVINEVSTCIVKDKNKCTATPNLCVVTENGKCNIVLPEKNLITNKNNKPIYFGRMADELIRYNRIKSFMLQPQIYLSFGNIGYNLRDNEIILVQSSLTQEYFENLIPAVTNKYVKHNSYDEANPVITQDYENKIPSLDQAIGIKNQKICDKVEHDKITSSHWKNCFPEDYSEIEYSKYNFCTFNFIIDLIDRKTGEKHTTNQIKNELFNEYKKYLEDYKDKIIDMLIIEGKKTLGDQVIAETLSFSSLIYTDNYFLTPLDIWLLVNKFKIPTIFISQKYILQSKYEKHEFVAYGDRDDKFAFVILPGLRPENVPNYKLVKSDKGDIFIPIDKLNQDCIDKIEEAVRNKVTIEDYLEGFKMPTVYKKKKPIPFRIESDESIEVKPNKKKIILEKTEPISVEESITMPSKKQSRKVVIKGEPKNKTKRKPDIKKKKFLIIDSSDAESV